MGIESTPFEPGTTVLERYRVVRKLGKGGMGSVYLCDDLRLAVPVALKFMDGALIADARFVDQLLTETRLARRVTHPNVCRVHDVGEVDGVPFLSMEYIDGEDLKSLLRRIGRLPADKALQIARQLCLGLFAAHEHGVLHRDLKPQNVMVDGDGDVRITDFGIAIERERSVDGASVVGTPAYMAPEVLCGGAPSVKSDLYSLGLVLHEVFTGRRVYDGGSMTELVEARSRAPRPPSDYVRDLDREVERAILACLEPDPARRPETAMEVLAALPGHDPLALALAAGDTPSPAMIAAAGSRGAIAPRLAVTFVVAVIASVLGIVFLTPDVRQVDGWNAPLPEDVLVDRSRELACTLGADVDALEHGEEASGFVANPWSSGADTNLAFFHRRAERGRAIEPTDVKARASFDDPPLSTTGGIATRFDVHGHLREWLVAPGIASGMRAATAPDDTLWRASGLDRAAFVPATEVTTPPVYADVVRTFVGDDGGTPWSVTIATLRGLPVWFRAQLQLAEPRPSPPRAAWRGVAQLGLIGLAFCISLHTMRRKRGDVGGALRVGAAAFVAVVAFTALLGDHGGGFAGMARLLVRGMTHGVAVGALLALQYFAIETFVRRTWPHTVVGWTRLLSGRVADPVVGRDLLAGLAAGSLAALALCVAARLARDHAAAATVPLFLRSGTEEALSGIGHALGVLLELCVDLAREAFKLFFTLVLMRVVLRRTWLVAGVGIAAWSAIWAPPQPDLPLLPQLIVLGLFVVTVGLHVLVLMRYGLLATVASFVGLGVLLSFPLAIDPGHWSASIQAFAPVVLVAAVVFGYRTATRGSVRAGR